MIGAPAVARCIVSCTLTVCLCSQVLSSVCDVAIGRTIIVRDEQLQTMNVNRQIGLAGCRCARALNDVDAQEHNHVRTCIVYIISIKTGVQVNRRF